MKLFEKIKKILAGQKKPTTWQEAKDLLELSEYRNWLEKRASEFDQEITTRVSQHRDFFVLQQEKVEILAELERVKGKKVDKKS